MARRAGYAAHAKCAEQGAQRLKVSIVILRHRGLLQKVHIEECDVFGANRGPRPSADGLVSVDGLGPRLAPNRCLGNCFL